MARHTPEASTTGIHQQPPKGGMGGTVLLTLAGVAIFIAFFYWWHSYRRITGTIVSRSGVLGAWTLTPDTCRLLPSGDGVVLSEERQPKLSAAVNLDPEGGPAQVHLTSTIDDRQHLLEHDLCGEATLELHKGEDGIARSGQILFNCVAGPGGIVQGNVRFRNCK